MYDKRYDIIWEDIMGKGLSGYDILRVFGCLFGIPRSSDTMAIIVMFPGANGKNRITVN
jgi:hypothetical protein